ncbi:transaldolase [Candidatus Pelagibacter sp.]|nr:transaldolase [Candidatus Pelagibacter sp.]
MTKIFCDIADKNLVKKFNKKKIVKGFTTNPSLMRKAGARDYSKYSKEILKITNKPVSCEVFADNSKDMIAQGKQINKWGKNVYVKVPVTNSKGKFMGQVIKSLNQNKVKLNITAVYTSNQTRKILNNIDKKTKVIISIFAGRMADAGKDPLPELKKSINISKKYKNVQILWASTREPYNYIQAKEIGCQIITVPPSIIEKIEKFGKSFKKLTVDTVKGFLADAEKSKFKIGCGGRI